MEMKNKFITACTAVAFNLSAFSIADNSFVERVFAPSFLTVGKVVKATLVIPALSAPVGVAQTDDAAVAVAGGTAGGSAIFADGSWFSVQDPKRWIGPGSGVNPTEANISFQW